MKFEEMNEYTILALAEKATFKFDDKPFTVLPDAETEGRKFKHAGMRIKVNNGGPTTDKSVTSTFPINTSGAFPTINEKKIEYGRDLTASDKKKQLKVAKAALAYAFDELDAIYKSPTSDNWDKFEKKADAFSKLSDQEKKAYIKLGSEK